MHPPELGVDNTDNKLNSNIKIEGDKVRFNLQEASFEIEVLKLEGKAQQAQTMEKLVRQQKIDRVLERYHKVERVGKIITSSIAKGLDAMLDSDSENDEQQNKNKMNKTNSEEEFDEDQQVSNIPIKSKTSNKNSSRQKILPSSPDSLGQPTSLRKTFIPITKYDEKYDEGNESKDSSSSSNLCALS